MSHCQKQSIDQSTNRAALKKLTSYDVKVTLSKNMEMIMMLYTMICTKHFTHRAMRNNVNVAHAGTNTIIKKCTKSSRVFINLGNS